MELRDSKYSSPICFQESLSRRRFPLWKIWCIMTKNYPPFLLFGSLILSGLPILLPVPFQDSTKLHLFYTILPRLFQFPTPERTWTFVFMKRNRCVPDLLVTPWNELLVLLALRVGCEGNTSLIYVAPIQATGAKSQPSESVPELALASAWKRNETRRFPSGTSAVTWIEWAVPKPKEV